MLPYELKIQDTQHFSMPCRLDVVLSHYLTQFTRSYLIKLIKDNHATVNNITINKPSYMVHLGDYITLTQPPPKDSSILPVNLPLTIIFEDDWFIIVNKKAGMTVHPAPGHKDDTLVNALLYHTKGRLSSIGGVLKPGIVHRIDKDTSGLMIVAKSDQAHQYLTQNWHEKVTKIYHGFVLGIILEDHQQIDDPIGRNPLHRKKMSVQANGKPASTKLSVIRRYFCVSKKFRASEVKFQLNTGRTHQIRVHMENQHHPLIGDPLYAPPQNPFPIKRQALHSQEIAFIHPNGQKLSFQSPLPDDIHHLQTFLNHCVDE